MRHRYLIAALIPMLAFASGSKAAQNAKPMSEVVVAPFVIEVDNADALRPVSASCTEQLARALELKGVVVAREPALSEKNLASAPASWALLGRITRDKGQFQVELRLLDAKSGDELRAFFNSDKDLKVACQALDKVAERVAAFVSEQKGAH